MALPLGLSLVLALAASCRRKTTGAVAQREHPVSEEAKVQAQPSETAPPAVPQGQASAAPVTVESFKATTEFADLTKQFQMYCNFKKRVPTDINEFFRDQKIKPPVIPPGTRLAIEPTERKIILVN
ncbi:MAG: hypothetical protein HZA92_01590 [Verrucomicrobia bacterium]|nr:hypothetical protein [Verrucomicrobiota bacterium]